MNFVGLVSALLRFLAESVGAKDFLPSSVSESLHRRVLLLSDTKFVRPVESMLLGHVAKRQSFPNFHFCCVHVFVLCGRLDEDLGVENLLKFEHCIQTFCHFFQASDCLFVFLVDVCESSCKALLEIFGIL